MQKMVKKIPRTSESEVRGIPAKACPLPPPFPRREGNSTPLRYSQEHRTPLLLAPNWGGGVTFPERDAVPSPSYLLLSEHGRVVMAAL